MDGVALAVAENLHFDMAGMGEVFLEIDGIVAESGLRFVARGEQRRLELVLEQRKLHAAPAAACRRLDQHRIADARARHVLASSKSSTGPEPGTTGMPSCCAVTLAWILSPMSLTCSAVGPMKVMLVLLEDLGEAGILGEEAVAGMHRIRAGDLAGRDDGRDIEIAVLGRGRRRCTRSRRRGAHAWRRRRRWSAPPRWRCRAPCRRVRREARSLPGWRSGSCRTSRPG